MTAAQLQAAQMLIPGAYEPSVPPHRAAQPARLASAPVEDVRVQPATEPSVVAAPSRPTTRWGYAAAILGDVALVTGIIYGVAVVPALAMYGIRVAAELILGTFGD
jgi:hypothetical protein